jgi:hypothetical protein
MDKLARDVTAAQKTMSVCELGHADLAARVIKLESHLMGSGTQAAILVLPDRDKAGLQDSTQCASSKDYSAC